MTEKPVLMTVFMLVKTTPDWLALPDDARARALAEHVEPALKRHGTDVRLRYYDAEFYSARVTDLWVWEVRDHEAYQSMIEALRDTPFWDRYFQILDIIPAVEDAYARDRAPLAA
jgi:chlorite dismutase